MLRHLCSACYKVPRCTRVLGRVYEVLMNHTVGIWIDHKRAVIVSVSAGRVTTKTLESEAGAHSRYSRQQDDGGEKKYEVRPSWNSGSV